MFTLAIFLGKFVLPVVSVYLLYKVVVGMTMAWQAKMDFYFTLMGY